MAPTVVPLHAARLTAEAFRPFGWLPVADTDPRDGEARLHFEWADPHLNVIAHAPDEVDHASTGSCPSTSMPSWPSRPPI